MMGPASGAGGGPAGFSGFGGGGGLPVTGFGGGGGAYGLQPQPVGMGDNDLTQYLRSLTNLTGQLGPSLVSAGTGLVGGALPVIGGGVGVEEQGLGTMQPSIDFYTKLLSGDSTTTAMALAPTAANINTITAGATDQASRGMPGGGYRASTLAGLPFQQASQVGNAALALQPAAASALRDLGQAQAGIGKDISTTGLGVGQLGTTLSSQGLNALQEALNALLQKAGINVQETGQLITALL